jgi:5-methylcytosine-specific restriction enzyme subunit McrC
MSPIELFEHETLRVGQRGLTQAQFVELVRFNDRTGRRYFTVGHQTITARHHVGYLEVGRLAIQILPKADRRQRSPGAWQDALLDMLRVASGLRLASPTSASQQVGRASLLELVAARFVTEVERLLHEGLARGYRSCEENTSAFRGRLVVAAHLRDNLVRADRFYVEHHVHDRDILVNRILAAALDAVRDLALSASLAGRAAACEAAFAETTPLLPTAATFARVPVTRATARYADALLLARMLLEHRAPQLRAGVSPVFAILFDMNQLWERYVAWLFRRALPAGASLAAQESRPFWRAQGRVARTIRPDLVVRRSDRSVLLVADAKWKSDDDGPAMGDLRQMFVYNELLAGDRALLVYPGGDGGARGRFAVPRGHTCETVHLAMFDGDAWSPPRMIGQLKETIGEAIPSEEKRPRAAEYSEGSVRR